jgi:hypothetical protein
VSLNDRLHQLNQSLRFSCEGWGMKVCGGKGLIDKYPSSSLYLAFLVIICGALGFPQGRLQGSRNLRRGGVLTETG